MKNTPSTTIYSIYCITNLINQKKHIGFTVKLPAEKRFKEHCRKIISKDTIISKAIQKYSKENFKFEVILQGLDREEVLSMETFFINEYNTLSPNGYNMTMGGEGTFGFKHTIAHKEKMRNININKVVSDETKKKLSEIAKNRKFSDETRNKMSNSLIGKRKGKNHPMYNKKHSKESKIKMSKKYLVEFPNGKTKEIIGISRFCNENDIGRCSLMNYSKLNKSYKGYRIILN